jgi:hypothetical protein
MTHVNELLRVLLDANIDGVARAVPEGVGPAAGVERLPVTHGQRTKHRLQIEKANEKQGTVCSAPRDVPTLKTNSGLGGTINHHI